MKFLKHNTTEGMSDYKKLEMNTKLSKILCNFQELQHQTRKN